MAIKELKAMSIRKRQNNKLKFICNALHLKGHSTGAVPPTEIWHVLISEKCGNVIIDWVA